MLKHYNGCWRTYTTLQLFSYRFSCLLNNLVDIIVTFRLCSSGCIPQLSLSVQELSLCKNCLASFPENEREREIEGQLEGEEEVKEEN